MPFNIVWECLNFEVRRTCEVNYIQLSIFISICFLRKDTIIDQVHKDDWHKENKLFIRRFIEFYEIFMRFSFSPTTPFPPNLFSPFLHCWEDSFSIGACKSMCIMGISRISKLQLPGMLAPNQQTGAGIYIYIYKHNIAILISFQNVDVIKIYWSRRISPSGRQMLVNGVWKWAGNVQQ